jgi:hypothetical protein
MNPVHTFPPYMKIERKKIQEDRERKRWIEKREKGRFTLKTFPYS